MRKIYARNLSVFMTFLLLFQLLTPVGSVLAESSGTMLPPSNLSHNFVTPDDVTLKWNSVFGAQGYNIYEITEGQLLLHGTTSGTSYALSNLSEGSYSYAVSTLSPDGESGPSAPITVNIVYPEMTAPTSLTNTIQNGNDIVLNWSSVQYAEKYNVYEVGSDSQQTKIASVTGLTHSITNAASGTYTYTVSSENTMYGESITSSTLEVSVVPPQMTAPTNLTYSVANGSDVNLKWNAINYATGYNIYQIIDGQKEFLKTVSTTSVTLTNIPAGEYTYAVHSYSDRFGESVEGSQTTATVSAVTMNAPSNLTYKVQNINDVFLSWGSVAYATSYNIYRVIEGQKELVKSVTGTSTTLTNMPGGDFTFVVHSYSDRFGESAEGSQVSVTIESVSLTAPNNFNYRIQNGNDIVLTWESAPYAAVYKVYQIVDGQRNLKTSTSSTTITYANQPENAYVYEVYSYNDKFGESSEGSQVSFQLVHPIMQPPANVVKSNETVSGFTLSWDAADYATSYKVYQVVNGQKILKSSVTGKSVTYSNMQPGNYSYVVHAVSSRFGESLKGTELSFTLAGHTMEAPTNLSYTVTNGNDITLKWTAASYATSYKIYQVSDGSKTLKGTVTSTSVTYTNQPAGSYHYEIYSVSSLFGESQSGAELSFELVFPTIAPPENLTYKIQNGNDVVLSWTSAHYASSYNIYELKNGEKVLLRKVTSLTTTFSRVPEGDYTYIVHTVSSRFGESTKGSEVSFQVAEQTIIAPANLTYSVANGNDITLKWDAVTNATSYKVYRLVDDQKVLQRTITGTSTTFTNTPEGDYTYTVHAYSDRFGESPEIGVSFTVVFPSMEAPSDMTHKIQNGNDIVLTWGTVPYANSYKLYEVINGQKVLNRTVNAASLTLFNVAEGDHTYIVHSVSSRFGESVEGIEIEIKIIFPTMEAPSNFTHRIQNGNDIVLTWGAVPYANSYKVYEIINGQKVLNKTVNTTSLTIINVAEGEHKYVVHSVSSRFGESNEGSQLVIDVIFPIMQAPQSLTHTILNGNDIRLNWTTSTYATTYKIYQIIDGQKVLQKTLSGTTATFANMPEGEYTYEVHSYSDRFGESPEAAVVNFRLDWPVVQPPIVEGSVFNVNNITFSWKSVPWANEYRVYKITDSTRQLIYKGTALSYKVYNLTEDTHSFEVTAFNTRFGESAPSNRITETVVYPDMKAPIANLRLTSDTSAFIYWNFVSYANGYNVYEIIEGEPVLIAKNVNNLSYTVSNLSYANHEYYVTAFSNSFGESDASNIVLAKLIVDTEAPVTESNAPTEWMNDDVVVTLSATDNETGVASTFYSLNDREFVEGTSISLKDEGVHKLSFYSVDKVGNKEAAQTIEVKIDKTAPIIDMNLNREYSLGSNVPLLYSVKDSLSGISSEKLTVLGPDTMETVIDNGSKLQLDKPGVYNVTVSATNGAGLTTIVKKQFVVYIPVTIEVTPKVIKGNKGVFTVRANLPSGYSSKGFDLHTVKLNGVKALNNNDGYYNQAKLGQFKFERSDFNWIPSEVSLELRGYVNGYLVIGHATVIVQK